MSFKVSARIILAATINMVRLSNKVLGAPPVALHIDKTQVVCRTQTTQGNYKLVFDSAYLKEVRSDFVGVFTPEGLSTLKLLAKDADTLLEMKISFAPATLRVEGRISFDLPFSTPKEVEDSGLNELTFTILTEAQEHITAHIAALKAYKLQKSIDVSSPYVCAYSSASTVFIKFHSGLAHYYFNQQSFSCLTLFEVIAKFAQFATERDPHTNPMAIAEGGNGVVTVRLVGKEGTYYLSLPSSRAAVEDSFRLNEIVNPTLDDALAKAETISLSSEERRLLFATNGLVEFKDSNAYITSSGLKVTVKTSLKKSMPPASFNLKHLGLSNSDVEKLDFAVSQTRSGKSCLMAIKQSDDAVRRASSSPFTIYSVIIAV